MAFLPLLDKKKKKKKATIEGARTEEERKEIKETKSIPERKEQFQAEKKKQEGADPKLTQAPTGVIKGGAVPDPNAPGRLIIGTETIPPEGLPTFNQQLQPQGQAGAAPTTQPSGLAGVLEQAGAFETGVPQEVSLQPSAQPGEQLPLIGTSLAALQSTFLQSEQKKTGKDAFDFPQDPLTIREASLRKIREDSFNKGITDAEKFGTLVESIPLIGAAANTFSVELAQTPSKNADQVVGEISKLKEAASTGQEKVRNGLEDPDYGLGRAREMEEQIASLEGRLQLLINSSPVLRANTDEINKIQEEILEAREKVARYKQASSLGLTAQLSGTGRIIPTDEQLFLELKGSRSS